MAEKRKQISITEENLTKGIQILNDHILFGDLGGYIEVRSKATMGKNIAAIVNKDGTIYVNKNVNLEPKQWAYAIAHCKLHLAFGHFDAENMPGIEIPLQNGKTEWKVTADRKLWNIACDIYISKFMQDMKFGTPLYALNFSNFGGSLTDERKIYQYLVESGVSSDSQTYGTASISSMDMQGLEKPLIYDIKNGEENYYAHAFAQALAYSVKESVSIAGGHGSYEDCKSRAGDAMEWFVSHYPMLGHLASTFKLVEDRNLCMQEDIGIAAIDVNVREIYINPTAKLSESELRFVIAHELLHAGLSHQERCQGRDPYIWNVACDFVINGWLVAMKIGSMPQQGLLYDEKYKDRSAEDIYDEIIKELKKFKRLDTFRGYGKGDILDRSGRKPVKVNGVSLDEFCRTALAQGLEFHVENCRGFVPAGLIEEIRALAMPAIPWDVELAAWFDEHFPPLEKHRTYARPSRRQSSTPDIPRPRSVLNEIDGYSRTFGVVIDTSGSMTANMIGKALGSVASYAVAKDVPFVRVIFCDATAYDAGYIAPDDIAGIVEVKGRGGTVLQPAITKLEKAKDFPADGPILVITDGYIEDKLDIHHEQAFLIPKGNRLPFRARGKVFYFD